MSHHVTTFWYVDTEDPSAPIRVGAAPDPGFARRLLSRLFPTVTVASLGEFPLNRSASAGAGEIYIGSFPGLTLVQTPEPDPLHPSATDPRWLQLLGTPVALSFSHDSDSGASAFARWESGRLVRSFSAAADRIIEDEGMPLPFERPFWSGEFPLVTGADDPLALPFDPAELLHAAHRDWLGFDLDPSGQDVRVTGFATDGRREMRGYRPHMGPAIHLAGTDPGPMPTPRKAESSPYAEDDYERVTAPDSPTSRPIHSAFDAVRATTAAAAGFAARGLKSGARAGIRTLRARSDRSR